MSLHSLHRRSGSDHVLGMKTAWYWHWHHPTVVLVMPGMLSWASPGHHGERSPHFCPVAAGIKAPLGSAEGQHTWEKKSQEQWLGCCSPHRAQLEFCSSPEDAMGQTHTSKRWLAPLPPPHLSLWPRLPHGLEELDKNLHFYFILLYLVPTTLHGGGILS